MCTLQIYTKGPLENISEFQSEKTTTTTKEGTTQSTLPYLYFLRPVPTFNSYPSSPLLSLSHSHGLDTYPNPENPESRLQNKPTFQNPKSKSPSPFSWVGRGIFRSQRPSWRSGFEGLVVVACRRGEERRGEGAVYIYIYVYIYTCECCMYR